MKLPHIYVAKKIVKLIIVVIGFIGYLGATLFLIVELNSVKQNSGNLRKQFEEVKQAQENFQLNFSDDLFEDHLEVMKKVSLENELDALQLELEAAKNSAQPDTTAQVQKVYDLYDTIQTKIKRNQSVKLSSGSSQEELDAWGQYLLLKDLTTLESSLSAKALTLDAEYKKYVDSLPKDIPVASTSSQGYSYLNIKTETGSSHGVYLIKLPLSEYSVKTVAAIEEDCKDNCPTKTLQQYVSENGAYAGITGSYACPADYASCSGKVWSFDFALYDSNDRKWFNKKALTWFETGMIAFNGSTPLFYRKTSEYDGDTVTAAVSNFPSLLKNSDVVVDDDDLTSYQKVRALRGAIGVGSENVYLAYITNATVRETAYAMKALGAKNALNLDGGGTAAMMIGGKYMVGPGRPLANAILLIKK